MLVLIPSYQPTERLADIVAGVRTELPHAPIIVVDDGSGPNRRGRHGRRSNAVKGARARSSSGLASLDEAPRHARGSGMRYRPPSSVSRHA